MSGQKLDNEKTCKKRKIDKEINKEENDVVLPEEDIIQLVPKVKIVTNNEYMKVGKKKEISYEFIDAEDSTPVWTVESDVNIPYVETPEGLIFEVPYDLSLVGNHVGVTISNSSGQCFDSIVLKIRGVV